MVSGDMINRQLEGTWVMREIVEWVINCDNVHYARYSIVYFMSLSTRC